MLPEPVGTREDGCRDPPSTEFAQATAHGPPVPA